MRVQLAEGLQSQGVANNQVVLQSASDHREMLESRDWLRSALAEKKNGNFCEKE